MISDKPFENIPLLDAPSLTDAVATALRARIIAGALPPGERITEGWVAQEFSVARPTAKASLDRLTGQGLLRRGPRKSAVVPLFSREDVRDIYFSREAIELPSVAMLAATRTVPGRATKALLSMQHAASQADYIEHIEADIEFHRGLVAGTGSLRLIRMHETIMGEVQLCIAQVQKSAHTDLGEVTRDHSAILDAIADGDSDRAAAALTTDLLGASEGLMAELDP